MRADTLWARKKDKANTHGLMDPHIVENGLITELMGKESTCGKMAVNSTENGSTTIWKAMVSTTGQMAEDMKDSITTIRNAVLASITGQTDANMKDGGIKASSMALEPTLIQAKKRLNLAFGKVANALSGLTSKRFNRYLKINLITLHFSQNPKVGELSDKTRVFTDLQVSTQA